MPDIRPSAASRCVLPHTDRGLIRRHLLGEAERDATSGRFGRLRAAVPGTPFSNRLESLGASGAYTSTDALLLCTYALALTATLGAVSGLVRRRR